MTEAHKQLLASLVAAISILRRADEMKVPPSKAVASDTMFRQMLTDYERAVEAGRADLSELDRLRSSNEAMRKALEDLCGVMDHCSVTSGICGCGESMDNHSEWSGHSPTDYGSYVAEKAYQSARAALSLQEEEAR